MIRITLLTTACVLLLACATPATQPVANVVSAEHDVGPSVVVGLTGNTRRGDKVSIAGEYYQVLASYYAASGRRCKKLQSQTDQRIRVACKDPTGSWYLRDPLSMAPEKLRAAQSSPGFKKNAGLKITSGLNKTAGQINLTAQNPGLQSEPIADRQLLPPRPQHSESAVQPPRTEIVQPGESLWQFSRRVTGNALNWQKIAEFNGVTEVTKLRAGAILGIPDQFDLAKTGS